MHLVDEVSTSSDFVCVSIFVNPTQFGEGEDFGRYPSDIDSDLEKLSLRGVDAVFLPTTSEMYLPDASTWVHVEGADEHLCGRFRPGHFRGVTTVVSKLFHACQPHVAVFGLKDAQQFLILRKMVRDLAMDVVLVGCQTVRESDGLAMSSRNAFLSQEDRREAPVLSRAVAAAREQLESGERSTSVVLKTMTDILNTSKRAVIQYAEIVDTATIAPIQRAKSGMEVLAAVAVYFGKTRLIDSSFVTIHDR